MLKQFYKQVNTPEKQIEIVFCSGDKEASEFKEYSEIMPWKAIPFGDKHIADAALKFKVASIPTLIILKPDGTVVSDNAVADVKKNGPLAIDDWL